MWGARWCRQCLLFSCLVKTPTNSWKWAVGFLCTSVNQCEGAERWSSNILRFPQPRSALHNTRVSPNVSALQQALVECLVCPTSLNLSAEKHNFLRGSMKSLTSFDGRSPQTDEARRDALTAPQTGLTQKYLSREWKITAVTQLDLKERTENRPEWKWVLNQIHSNW